MEMTSVSSLPFQEWWHMLIAQTTFSMSSNIIGLLNPYDEIHRVLALCKVQTNWDVVSSLNLPAGLPPGCLNTWNGAEAYLLYTLATSSRVYS